MTRFSQIMRAASTLSSPSTWLQNIFHTPSKTGVNVTVDTAMQHTAVYVCVKILSESLASLPFGVHKRITKNGRTFKEKAHNHNLYHLLHNEPNTEMTSFTWRIAMMSNLCLRGASFSQIIRNNAGNVVGIYPLYSEKMVMKRHETTNELYYVYDNKAVLDSNEVLHVVGETLDGINSMSPIYQNRHAIGLSMAAEEFGSNHFKNGANPSGIIQNENQNAEKLSNDAYERLRQSFKDKYQGLHNSGKPILLEEGYVFNPITINQKDSQFLESRKFSKAEIGSIYRIPPHMLNEMDKATFSNIEHQSMQFVIDAIRPWVVRIEQECDRKLFTKKEKSIYFTKFNLTAILRGDTKARMDFYNKGIVSGWLTRNEVRELEDLNPIDGLDEPLTPLNMITEEEKKNEEK